MKILIPNATGPSNLGDQVMLEVLVNLLRNAYANADIVVHSTDCQKYPKKLPYCLSPSIYEFVGLLPRNEIVRLYRVLQLIFLVFLVLLGFEVSAFGDQLSQIIQDYRDADLIVFVGGGYLRSRKSLSQNLNLLLILSNFYLASITGARTIVAPISFGPFAKVWQARLTASILSRFDFVFSREGISHKLMKEFGVKNLISSSDNALLFPRQRQTQIRTRTIGYTIRNWPKDFSMQRKLEETYVQALQHFCDKTHFTVQPIIQATASHTPNENDQTAAHRVYCHLREKQTRVRKPITLNNLAQAVKVYSSIDMLLGMRMHSNIIAATQGVPFIAVSYEHKTEGITKQLGMEEFCISWEDLTAEELYLLLMKSYQQRKKISRKLTQGVGVLAQKETKKWNHFLRKAITH